MPTRKDLAGSRFGSLIAQTAVSRLSGGRKKVVWSCICDCGNTCEVKSSELSSGDTKSCGCFSKAHPRLKHGYARRGKAIPEYKIWNSMKDRCCNPNNKHFDYYGGRSISVCEEWLSSFEKFYQDMGDRPSQEHSIDRLDGNGNYEPNNCRWATKLEQALNRKERVGRGRIKLDGIPLRDLARQAGIRERKVLARFKKGIRGAALFDNADGRTEANKRRSGMSRPEIGRDSATKRFIPKRLMNGSVEERS